MIVSHALWQSWFGGSRDVLGRDAHRGGESLTVVGVMPAGFRLPLRHGPLGPPLVGEQRSHHPPVPQLAPGRTPGARRLPRSGSVGNRRHLGPAGRHLPRVQPDQGAATRRSSRGNGGGVPAVALGAGGSHHPRPPHRVRQRGQPPVGSGIHPHLRAGHPGRTRSHAIASHAPTPGGVPDPGPGGRELWGW